MNKFALVVLVTVLVVCGATGSYAAVYSREKDKDGIYQIFVDGVQKTFVDINTDKTLMVSGMDYGVAKIAEAEKGLFFLVNHPYGSDAGVMHADIYYFEKASGGYSKLQEIELQTESLKFFEYGDCLSLKAHMICIIEVCPVWDAKYDICVAESARDLRRNAIATRLLPRLPQKYASELFQDKNGFTSFVREKSVVLECPNPPSYLCGEEGCPCAKGEKYLGYSIVQSDLPSHDVLRYYYFDKDLKFQE